MSLVEQQAAARIFPHHSRMYSGALTGTSSTEILASAIVGADGERVGEKQRVGIQCSVKTHIKMLAAASQATADTNDFYLDAGEIWEGYLMGAALVYYATAAGRINIWESSR